MGQSISGFCYSRSRYRDYDLLPASGYSGSRGILSLHRKYIEYTPIDECRWSLASQVLENFPELRRIAGEYEDRLFGPHTDYRVQDRIKNWPKQVDIFDILFGIARGEFLFSIEHLWMFSSFTLAGILYGALHLLAWNASFTSKPQDILWRVSGIAIALSGPVVVVFILLFWLLRLLLKCLNLNFETWRGLLGFSILCPFLLFYLFARAYLVIECFIYLSYLPDSVFQQPQWSHYFPHIM